MPGNLPTNLGGELARLAEVRRRGLPPQEVRVRRVAERARDRVRHRMGVALLQPEEALARPLARNPRVVALVDVAGDQRRRMGIGTRHDQRLHAADVGGQTRRIERADERLRRHQNLAAEVAALLLRGKLVLEVDRRRARLDHPLHQLEGVERTAETCLGIGHDRREPVRRGVALELGDLVGALQRLVDAAHDLRHRRSRVERLVGIHLAGIVGVGGDLPARQVDGVEAGLDLLQRLVAGERAERGHHRALVQELPQAAGAELGERVFDGDGALQPFDGLRRIVAADAGEPVCSACHDVAPFQVAATWLDRRGVSITI